VSSPDGVDTTPYGVTTADGVVTQPTTPPPTTPPPTTGSGLSVRVSEDAYNGNAQFIVHVDGQQVGGTFTATASHAAGQWQDIAIGGTYSTGPHTIDVQFINDAWGGSSTTDRNLYVQSVTINGETISHGTAPASISSYPSDGSIELAGNGAATYSATGTGTSTPPTNPPPPTSTTGTIVLHVSEDAFKGDAQFTVFVDGHQIGGTQTATANHSKGQWQDITLTGPFDNGPHTIDVNYVNDLYSSGKHGGDRNLYVQSVTIDGEKVAATSGTNTAGPMDSTVADMFHNGTLEVHSQGNALWVS
jgi:hypothetical protein